MRKNINFKLCGEEVSVPITFDTIERIERAFNANADVIATIIIPNMTTIPFSKLARVVSDVVAGHEPKNSKLTRETICEYLMGAPGMELAGVAIQLQTACLYIRNQIDPEEFDRIEKQTAEKMTAQAVKTTRDAT